MPQFNLTALPSHPKQEQDGSNRTRCTEIMGAYFGRTRAEARTVADVRALVTSFGSSVAAQRPGTSFTVMVSIVAGSRKPAGFDAASPRGGLGQDAWMQTVIKDQPQQLEAALP